MGLRDKSACWLWFREHTRDEVVRKDVDWFPDGTLETRSACCLGFDCLKDSPHCYCESHGCGVASGFWFDWQGVRLLIAGAGQATE